MMNTYSSSDLLDVIIVGAGPTGLSVALLLGRSRKHVLVIDSGQPRNALSHAANGFFREMVLSLLNCCKSDVSSCKSTKLSNFRLVK